MANWQTVLQFLLKKIWWMSKLNEKLVNKYMKRRSLILTSWLLVFYHNFLQAYLHAFVADVRNDKTCCSKLCQVPSFKFDDGNMLTYRKNITCSSHKHRWNVCSLYHKKLTFLPHLGKPLSSGNDLHESFPPFIQSCHWQIDNTLIGLR